MDNNDAGLVLEMIAQSNHVGGWCGDSYIQKVSYIAKAVLNMPLSVPFVLYKRGPYSFELKSLLLEMRASRLVMLVPDGHYGPSFVIIDNILTQRLRTNVSQYSASVARLVKDLSRKSIADLEAFSTAIMFWGSQQNNPDKYVDELNRLLPSLSRSDAAATVEEAHEFLKLEHAHA
jgi:uncharacterized protein YwgA